MRASRAPGAFSLLAMAGCNNRQALSSDVGSISVRDPSGQPPPGVCEDLVRHPAVFKLGGVVGAGLPRGVDQLGGADDVGDLLPDVAVFRDAV